MKLCAVLLAFESRDDVVGDESGEPLKFRARHQISDAYQLRIFSIQRIAFCRATTDYEVLSKFRCTVDENVETIQTQAVNFVDLTTSIVSAYVSKNSFRPADMAELIASTHTALAGLGTSAAPAAPTAKKLSPAQIRKSVTPDAIISFIDGKPYKALKRHLTGNGLTIEQYRERFGLPRDYPTTAVSYSEKRSALAKSLGLGQQRKKAAETISDKPKRAADRPRKAEGDFGA